MNIQQLDVCAVIQASYGFINGTASDIVCYECIYARYEQEVSPGSIFRDPVCKKKVEKSVSFLFFFSFHNRAKYLVGLLVKMLNSVKRKIAHEQTLIVLIKVKISVVTVQDKVKVKRVFFFFKCI